MFTKKANTLYQIKNNIVSYVSITKQAHCEIVIVIGDLGMEPKTEILKFSSIKEAETFYEDKYRQYSMSHAYQPNFVSKKIGFNLQGLDELEIVDIWIPFNQFLESHLFLSGNGYIPNEFYDEINEKWIHSTFSENNIYSICLFVIDFNYTLTAIKQYLEINEIVDLITFL